MILLEIDESSVQAKKIIDLLKTFEFVKISNTKTSTKKTTKSLSEPKYNKDFVSKIKKRNDNVKKGNYLTIDAEYKTKYFS